MFKAIVGMGLHTLSAVIERCFRQGDLLDLYPWWLKIIQSFPQLHGIIVYQAIDFSNGKTDKNVPTTL